MSEDRLCTCNKCGWVHMAVTRGYAAQKVIEFNQYYDKLSEEKQQNFYGGKGATIGIYERCFSCGQTDEDFRPFKEGDCPGGVTIQPTIYEGKKSKEETTCETPKSESP